MSSSEEYKKLVSETLPLFNEILGEDFTHYFVSNHMMGMISHLSARKEEDGKYYIGSFEVAYDNVLKDFPIKVTYDLGEGREFYPLVGGEDCPINDRMVELRFGTQEAFDCFEAIKDEVSGDDDWLEEQKEKIKKLGGMIFAKVEISGDENSLEDLVKGQNLAPEELLSFFTPEFWIQEVIEQIQGSNVRANFEMNYQS